MDSESPPRKKLKQARLPFQILSHKDAASDSSPSTASRKRPLSEDSHDDDDVVVVKVGKTEEVQENGKSDSSSICAEDKETEAVNVESSEKVEVGTSVSTPEKDVADKENSKLEEGSILQSKMKSTLANLFVKKVFDVTADVGSCDCGCEDANSDDEAEALEEYLEHCKKRKISPSKAGKKAKARSKKKSENAVESSLSNESPSAKSSIESPKQNVECVAETTSGKNQEKPEKSNGCSPSKSKKKSGNSSSGSPRVKKIKDSPKQKVESVGEATEGPKEEKPEKSNVLSRKAHDMFAKWRKSPSEAHTSDSAVNLDITKVKDKASHETKKPKSEEDLPKSLKEEGIQKSDLKEVQVSDYSDVQRVLKKENADGESENIKTEESSKTKLSAEGTKSSDLSGRTSSSLETPVESSSGPVQVAAPKTPSDKEQLRGAADNPILVEHDKPFPLTPNTLSKTPVRRLTPKQLERQKESTRKQEERERQKLERDNEKKRLKQEKDEQKRKEKEEKEEQRRKDKEEKEKKKQAEQEQKIEEKRRKESLKAEEKRRKEEDKKKAEEEEERKKAKASVLITSFFVPKTSKPDCEDAPLPAPSIQNFMPFEVKADMRVAPRVRFTLSSPQKKSLDQVIELSGNQTPDLLYLTALKSGQITPKVSCKTWPRDEIEDDDDVCVLEPDDDGALIEDKKKVEKIKAKFLQFHENHRPAYRGTWRKKSAAVTGRRPFGQDKVLDYEVDSADEWEEEEPGESLHGSDDEKEKESEDEYEVDNTVFVPHGYLSEDEGDEDENEEMSPETQKAKLKLLGEEFEAQMKSKTSALKPIIIVLTAALQASSVGSARYQKLFERRAVWQEDKGPIVLSELSCENDPAEVQALMASEANSVLFSSGPGAKKKLISEEAMPALITLVHGNQNKRIFLTNEFSAFLAKSQSDLVGDVKTSANADPSESNITPSRPTTPSGSVPNPLLLRWPGLPPASRISISNKIKEIATWGPCPEEGPMYNRMCWYISEEIRAKYKVTDLKLPNSVWHYTLKPKNCSRIYSPNANASPSTASGVDSRALITKFTKVMTPEEKQRQWELMKTTISPTPPASKPSSSKSSSGKITAFTQHVKTPGGSDSIQEKSKPERVISLVSPTTTLSNQPQAKKRVPLLVSVPRGHQISSSPSHCSLLSKFEASVSAQNSNSVPSPKGTTTSSHAKKDDECITLD